MLCPSMKGWTHIAYSGLRDVVLIQHIIDGLNYNTVYLFPESTQLYLFFAADLIVKSLSLSLFHLYT